MTDRDHARPPSAGEGASKHVVLVAVLLTIGLVLRLHNLDDSIWYDEAYSIWVSKLSLPALIDETAHPAFAPPLHYILLHYWSALFGDSIPALRALSILAGVLAVAMTYVVGRQMFGAPTGLAAAAMMAVAKGQVFYSQEVRMYSLLTLLGLVSAHFLLKLKNRPSRGNFWGYVLASIALLYTHNYAMFVVAAQSLYFLLLVTVWRHRTAADWKTFLASQGIIATSFLPWAFVLLDLAGKWRAEGYWTDPQSLQSLYGLMSFLSGSRMLPPLLLAVLIAALAWPLLARRLERRFPLLRAQEAAWRWLRRQYPELILVLLWVILPVIIPFLMSVLVKPALIARYVIAAQPAFFLLSARLLLSFGTSRHVHAALIAGVVLLELISLGKYYQRPGRYNQDWKGIAAYVTEHARPGDLVLFYSGELQLPFDIYMRRSDLVQKNITGTKLLFYSRLVYENNDVKFKDLPALLRQHDRVWVVVLWREPFKKSLGMFRKRYILTEPLEFLGLDLYFFEAKPKTRM